MGRHEVPGLPTPACSEAGVRAGGYNTSKTSISIEMAYERRACYL